MSVIPSERLALRQAMAGSAAARADLIRMFGARARKVIDAEPGRSAFLLFTIRMRHLGCCIKAFDGSAVSALAIAGAATDYAEAQRGLMNLVRAFASDACESMTGKRLDDLPPAA